MLESILVVIHIVIVVVGIGEEIILHGEDIGRTHIGFGKSGLFGFSYSEYVFETFVVIQVSSLLISQIGRRVSVSNDTHGTLDSDGTVISCEDDLDVVFTQSFKGTKQRRKFKPASRDGSIGSFIGSQFTDDVHLGYSVRGTFANRILVSELGELGAKIIDLKSGAVFGIRRYW